MMKLRMKVCGMRDRSNILEVALTHPDYLGFIFYEGSPRYVGADFVIPDGLQQIAKVGVFVNASLDEMLRQKDRLSLDVLQLHGQESPETVRELKARGVRIFKVFSMDDTFNFAALEPYVGYADYFLFDTKGRYHGGNAKVFNWKILEKYNQEVPFFLSGGLNESNIDHIKDLQGMNLAGVDLNSGVEDSPGVKNVTRIKNIHEKLKKL